MRRRFFLLAAPAIVAAPSLMRVSAAVFDSLPRPDPFDEFLYGDHSSYRSPLSELFEGNRTASLVISIKADHPILRYIDEISRVSAIQRGNTPNPLTFKVLSPLN